MRSSLINLAVLCVLSFLRIFEFALPGGSTIASYVHEMKKKDLRVATR